MNNKIKLHIKGGYQSSVYVEALPIEEIKEIYKNIDKCEIAEGLAKTAWDNSDYNTKILCEMDLETGEILYNALQSNQVEALPDRYPVIASIEIGYDIKEFNSDFFVEYEDEIIKRIREQKDYDKEIDDWEKYPEYYEIVEDVLDENGTSIDEICFNLYKDYISDENFLNPDFINTIEEIYSYYKVEEF